MAKVSKHIRDGAEAIYYFYCPGCNSEHCFDGRWKFRGTLDKPTFTPSLLVQGHLGENDYGTCHSYITDGKIRFLNDCTHYLRGRTVEIPEYEE